MHAEVPSRSLPRPHEELLAVVEGDRLMLASRPLLELTGYSRGEASSPEFRASYLFHPRSSLAALASEAHGQLHEALLTRPRGPPEHVLVGVHALALRNAPGVRALLFLPEPVDPEEVADRALRAVLASLRSALAEPLQRLRRLDEALGALADIPEAALRGRLPTLLALCDVHHGFDEPLRAAERSVQPQAPLRQLYQRT